MNPEQLDRVFGRGRLQMKTGRHVEVFREADIPGERRRYTKRFLSTQDGDFRAWTEREWRLLARMMGHGVRCVPDVVQFDRGTGGGTALVQTFDAGITVDHWATLLPVERDGRLRRHVFEDCAHWWALAHHTLRALDEIHRLQLVHLDLKADNVCIPYGPPDFDPAQPGQRLRPLFGELSLIDFAFSVVTGEALSMPLPIGWQPDYAYQSPRLLKALEAGRAGDLAPTRALDGRCDLFSLAAMLERYLPQVGPAGALNGWNEARVAAALRLLHDIRAAHDREDVPPHQLHLLHAPLLEASAAPLREPDLAASLERGWTLALDSAPAALPTPVTRLAPGLEPSPQAVAPTPVIALAGSAAADAHPPATPLVPPAPSTAAAAATAAPPRPPQPPAAAAPRRTDPLRLLMRPALIALVLLAVLPPLVERFSDGRPFREVLRSAVGLSSAEDSQAAAEPPAPVENFDQRAQRLLRENVPARAAQVEKEVGWALHLAAIAEDAGGDRDVLDVLRELPKLGQADSSLAKGSAPADARSLNEEARQAYWTRRNPREALALQRRAFGANPRDAEIAGNLAFLFLKQAKPQPETARRLALYALSLGGSQFPTGRSEDWGSFAVASALLGRPDDATYGLFVMLAQSRDLDRTCRAALAAVAEHGESMRGPAEALLRRVQVRGQAADAPACAWPPDWSAGTRTP